MEQQFEGYDFDSNKSLKENESEGEFSQIYSHQQFQNDDDQEQDQDSGSDEELNRKLKLLEGHHYDEWLQSGTTGEQLTEEEEEEPTDNLTLDLNLPKNEGKKNVFDEGKSSATQKLEEPYSSCLRELEEEERRRKRELLEKQKMQKRESSKSVQYQIPIPLTKGKKKVNDIEPWKYLPGSEIEHRQRILTSLDRQLEFQASQVKSLKQTFDKRWEKLATIQKTISDSLGQLNEVEVNCKDKRQVANEITAKTKSEIGVYNQNIKIHKKELETLETKLVECEKRLENHKIFQDFLHKVKDDSKGQFKTARQVTDRFHILQLIKDSLILWQSEYEKDISLSRLELHTTTKTRNKNNLLRDSYLSDLRKYHESNLNKLAILEDQLILVKTAAADQCMLHGQLDLCIQNLYLEICKQIHLEPKPQYTSTKARTKGKLLFQLHDIDLSMKQLLGLCRDIRGKLNPASCNADLEVATGQDLKNV